MSLGADQQIFPCICLMQSVQWSFFSAVFLSSVKYIKYFVVVKPTQVRLHIFRMSLFYFTAVPVIRFCESPGQDQLVTQF